MTMPLRNSFASPLSCMYQSIASRISFILAVIISARYVTGICLYALMSSVSIWMIFSPKFRSFSGMQPPNAILMFSARSSEMPPSFLMSPVTVFPPKGIAPYAASTFFEKMLTDVVPAPKSMSATPLLFSSSVRTAFAVATGVKYVRHTAMPRSLKTLVMLEIGLFGPMKTLKCPVSSSPVMPMTSFSMSWK